MPVSRQPAPERLEKALRSSPRKSANWLYRSATAAKEIKTLIETSSTQVGAGVSLVNETGTSLGQIEEQVGKINDLIQSIVTGAREQSTALAEINSAVNQMDQVTQQNAAMVEETNAATQGLNGEAVKLEGLVGRFNTNGSAGHSTPVAANASSTAGAIACPGSGRQGCFGLRLRRRRRGNCPQGGELERVLIR